MFQELETQLQSVVKIIQDLCDVEETNNPKVLKQALIASNKVIDIFTFELSKIEQLRIQFAQKLSVKTTEMKKVVEELETKFKLSLPKDKEKKNIAVDIGGITIPMSFYYDRTNIPILSYGAVLESGKILVLYRYNDKDYVSCSLPNIIDFPRTGEKIAKLSCCINEENCTYGDECRYFHDPAIFTGTKLESEFSDQKNKVQNKELENEQSFIRTQMVRNCPFFGDRYHFAEHVGKIPFKNLRTLARYCAIFNLLINISTSASSTELHGVTIDTQHNE